MLGPKRGCAATFHPEHLRLARIGRGVRREGHVVRRHGGKPGDELMIGCDGDGRRAVFVTANVLFILGGVVKATSP